MGASEVVEIKRSIGIAEEDFMSESCGRFAGAFSKLKSSRGASLVEYALLIGLIVVVCIGAMAFLGRSTEPAFTDLGDGFQTQNQN